MGLAIVLKKPDPNASRDDWRKRKDGYGCRRGKQRVNNKNYENTLVFCPFERINIHDTENKISPNFILVNNLYVSFCLIMKLIAINITNYSLRTALFPLLS